MKIKISLFAMTLALATLAHGATNDLTGLLQKGLFEEEANRDLTAAIANYQSLANAFDKDRQLAATAVFRLGECYRKLGKTTEAAAQYQRIIREFSDQQTLVTLSRQNLTGLNVASASANSDANESSLLDAEANVAALQTQIEEIKKMPVDQGRIYVQQNLPNPVLITLIQELDLAQQNLIKLKSDYTSDHPKYKNAQELVDDLSRKIDAQIEGVLIGLQSKLTVAQAQLNVLRQRQSEMAGTPGGGGSGESDTQLRLQVKRAQEQLADSNKELQELLKTYLPTNLRVLDQKKKIDLQNTNLAALMEKLQTFQGSSSGGATPITDEEQQEIRRIQFMIQNSPDLINSIGSDGITPLQDAASKGQLSVVKYLLDHGADVNRTGSSGPAWETALFKAANNGHKAMVELLISRGADINKFNPLQRVVSKNYTSVAEVLLANNANVNYHGSESRVPLHDAAANGATNLIRLLIDHGADLSARDNLGATPLHLAARAGEIDAAKMLLAAKAPIEATNNDAATPLHMAAQAGKANVVSLLLDSGANVNATNDDNATPLLLAVNSRAEETVRVLLAHKADPNRAGRIKYGPGNYSLLSRPIYFAIRSPKIVGMLLEAGADPEGQPDSPNTPLAAALKAPDIDCARLLLEHGANPNHLSYDSQAAVGTDYGDPPLATALRNPGDKAVIPLLLEKGADPNGKNAAGLAPLFLTTDPEIGRWLIDHKADINARFTVADGPRNGQPIPAFHVGPVAPASEGGFWAGYTPLMRAVVKAPEFAKFLLENGAKPDLQDTNENTALHYATYYAQPEGASVLLEHKANPNFQNEAGYTPLDIAKSGTGGWMGNGMLGGGNNGSSTSISAEKENQIAALLTGAGGLANLPKRNRIEVRRASNSGIAFTKGSHDWNRYSLLELMAGEYHLVTQSANGEWSKNAAVRSTLWNSDLRFPDFKNVIIYRRTDASARQKAINVNVEDILSSGDCSRDMWLEWGDVLEIPESDHPVDLRWPGLMSPTLTALTNCLARQVTIVVKGVRTPWKLAPQISMRYADSLGSDMLDLTRVSFMLCSVLDNSKLVRVSSDLSRVKVTRIDPDTKKQQEWVIDCTNPNQADLWLRDGDVIEVPEK